MEEEDRGRTDTKRPPRGCDDVVARREVVRDGTSPAADEDENETEDDVEISGVMIRRLLAPTPEATEEDAARRVRIMVLSYKKSSQCLSVSVRGIVLRD